MSYTIPPIYRSIGPVTGLPLNWRVEVSGVLPAAVNAYLNNRIDRTALDEIQFEIVRVFMEHYINAPCWTESCSPDEEMAADLATLRRDVLTLRTPDQMAVWIHRCLDIGVDPL